MSTWWKACLISFQIDLVPSQYHVGKATKSLRHAVAISAGSYIVIMGLFFTLGTKLEHAPRRWRTLQRCPRTSYSLATTLGGKQGRPSQVGGPIKLISSSSRAPGAACSKIDAQVVYGLRFRWSTYGWKDNLIRPPMHLVPCQNSFGINGNCLNNLMSKIYQGAASPSFGPCNVSGLLRDVNRGPWTPLRIYNL